MILIPKNWATFQHYKDRSPPWIKLHVELLDDFKFSTLPVASKALAPLLWLLASKHSEGKFEGHPGFLAFRLRWTPEDIKAGLIPLIDKGFMVIASGSLADCYHDAIPETEREAERETEGGASAPAAGAPKKPREQTLPEWLATIEGDAIPADDPIFTYASGVGLPADFLLIAWREFEARSTDSGKRYRDWRKAFRNCVRANWYSLWAMDREGAYYLTTAGKQAERAAQ